MSMLRIGIGLMIFLVAALFAIYGILDPMAKSCDLTAQNDPTIFCPRYVDLLLTLTLVMAAIGTLFGTLTIEGATNDDGSFKEQRIRLSIALSILVVFLIYFCMAIFWPADSYNARLLETLKDLMMVVIPFYFGSSAAVEWAEKRSKT